MARLSICIATCDRPDSLDATMEALLNQSRLPDEIVVSEPPGLAGRKVVESFAARMPPSTVRHVPSACSALPWQRWWAFQHSVGEITVFLDDDVSLRPEALEVLEDTYRRFEESSVAVAGVGFQINVEGGDRAIRQTNSFRERWLGTAALPGGSLTPGGLSVTLVGRAEKTLAEVEVLWGGAMSFRREVLEDVNCLRNLVALYDAGVGRGEDAVLSHTARRKGRLFAITLPMAFHPRPREARRPTPYAVEGWNLGLTNTWGRAHTMRWLSRDSSAYKQSWWRLAILEVGRSLYGILRRPWQRHQWLRLAGAFYGIRRSLIHWAEIPPLP